MASTPWRGSRPVPSRQANAELRAITAACTREGLYPEAMRFEAIAVSLDDEILAPIKPALWLVSAASFPPAHRVRQRREPAARARRVASQGAGASHRAWRRPARLLRQPLTETLILATAGARLGLLLAFAGMRLLARANLAAIPRVGRGGRRCRRARFCGAGHAADGAGVQRRAGPARLARRSHRSLKDGAQMSRRQRPAAPRSALIVAEMALAVLLLVSAGLMLRSIWALRQVQLGFDPATCSRFACRCPRRPTRRRRTSRASTSASSARAPAAGCHRRGRGALAAAGRDDRRLGPDVEGYVETPGNNAKGDWQVSTDGASRRWASGSSPAASSRRRIAPTRCRSRS